MLLWRQAGPYNAAHALCLPGPGSLERLAGAAAGLLDVAGLRCLTVDNATCRIGWADSPETQQDVAAHTLDPDAGLGPRLAAELNRSFPDEPHGPFRFRLIREPEHDRHWIVLIYDHVVADACGVQNLMADLLARYLGHSQRATCIRRGGSVPPVPLSAIGGWAGAWRFLACYFRLRYCHRLHEKRSQSSELAVQTSPIEELDAEALHNYARSRRVRRSDLVLAATASAIARMTPARRTHRQRRRIALGTVVSLRKPESRDLSLAPQLTSGIVVLDRPDAPPDELLSSIRAQTKGLRARGGQFCIPSGMFRSLGLLFGFRNDSSYYRKILPICAGVSPFAVDPQLYGHAAESVRRILRVCPTGPVLPMVLAPTFWQSRLELGFTYRQSCLDSGRAEEFLSLVAETLRSFAADAPDAPPAKPVAALAAQG